MKNRSNNRMRQQIHILLLEYMQQSQSMTVPYASFRNWLDANRKQPLVEKTLQNYYDMGYSTLWKFWDFERLYTWLSKIESLDITRNEKGRIILTQQPSK